MPVRYLEVGIIVLSIAVGSFLFSHAIREIIAKDAWYIIIQQVWVIIGVMTALIAVFAIASFIVGWIWCKVMDGIIYFLYRISNK